MEDQKARAIMRNSLMKDSIEQKVQKGKEENDYFMMNRNQQEMLCLVKEICSIL